MSAHVVDRLDDGAPPTLLDWSQLVVVVQPPNQQTLLKCSLHCTALYCTVLHCLQALGTALLQSWPPCGPLASPCRSSCLQSPYWTHGGAQQHSQPAATGAIAGLGAAAMVLLVAACTAMVLGRAQQQQEEELVWVVAAVCLVIRLRLGLVR